MRNLVIVYLFSALATHNLLATAGFAPTTGMVHQPGEMTVSRRPDAAAPSRAQRAPVTSWLWCRYSAADAGKRVVPVSLWSPAPDVQSK